MRVRIYSDAAKCLSLGEHSAFSYYFHGGGGAINAGTKGTLYVSSMNPEVDVIENYRGRLDAVAFTGVKSKETLTQTCSAISCLYRIVA